MDLIKIKIPNWNKTFRALGSLGLDGDSVEQRAKAIAQQLPFYDDDETENLQHSIRWLHERVMSMDISKKASLTTEIAAWYLFMKARSISDDLMLDEFQDWHLLQATENPLSSRRLMLALRELCKVARAVSDNSSERMSSFILASDKDTESETDSDQAKLYSKDLEDREIEDPEMISGKDEIRADGKPSSKARLTGSNAVPVGSIKTFARSKTQAMLLKMAPTKCKHCNKEGKRRKG